MLPYKFFQVNDLIGAGEYLKARTDVDGKKIGLWGGSYGGGGGGFVGVREGQVCHSGVRGPPGTIGNPA